MYTSTRSKMNVNASKAIIDGIAPDGGLFVKKLEKKFSHEDLVRLTKLSYKELAYEIMKLFFNDFEEKALKDLIEKAYSNTFDTENLVEENAINVKKIEGALTKFYEFVNENPDLANIFITHSNKEILSKRLLMILSERYSEIFDSLDVRNEDLKIPTDFVVSYITSIFIGTVNWWIEQKNHEMSANEFASLVIKLISNGHLTVLGVNINRD